MIQHVGGLAVHSVRSAKRVARQSMLRVTGRYEAYRLLERLAPDEPVTFNEKVLYRMAHNRDPILRRFANRVAAREYVGEVVGDHHLPRLLAAVSDARDIPWDELPEEYALKASHGSGGVVLVGRGATRGRFELTPRDLRQWGRYVIHPDDVDRRAITRLTRAWLKMSYEYSRYFVRPAEWAYSRVPRRIIAEELLLDESGALPDDYKLFVFGGTCQLIEVDRSRFGSHRREFYSPSWDRIDVTKDGVPMLDRPVRRPSNLDEMLEVARMLAGNTDFARVDLYSIDDRVIVGEITNYPASGSTPFEPVEFDRAPGEMWG